MKNKLASSFVVPFGTTLSEISHLGVADRWLETPKRARYNTLVGFLNHPQLRTPK